MSKQKDVEAVAGSEWWEGVVAAGSVKAARTYRGLGMTRYEVRMWRDTLTGASSRSIAAWYRTGLGPYRADLWRDWRVAPAAAARYHAAGWDVAEVADHDPDELVSWMHDLEEEHPGWEEWLRIKTTPAVVMVAAEAGLHAGDLKAMLRVTRDPAIVIYAIKNGHWAREPATADWPDSDFGAMRDLAAELQADADRLAKVAASELVVAA